MKRLAVLLALFVAGCVWAPAPLPPGPVPIPVPAPVPPPVPPPEPDGGARSFAKYQALKDALDAGNPPTEEQAKAALGTPYSDYVQADPPHHHVLSWHVRATTGNSTLAVHAHALGGTILSFVVE